MNKFILTLPAPSAMVDLFNSLTPWQQRKARAQHGPSSPNSIMIR